MAVGFTTTFAISAITTDVVSSNRDHGEVYNIMWLSLSVTRDMLGVFSRSYGFSANKTDRHDITEILLKVALNTIKQTNKQTYVCKLGVCCIYSS
jgi:hypothetical protein